MNKMIYIINEYSSKSTQHFYHVFNLLKELSNRGVKITLVIEKCVDSECPLMDGINVICQKRKNKILRVIELNTILRKHINQGYKKIFVRISTNAAIVSILTKIFSGREVFFWQSGTTYTLEKEEKKGISKLVWKIKYEYKFRFICRFVNKFVTGPEFMLDYYEKEVGVRKEKLHLLYNDIDINRFHPISQLEKQDMKSKLNLNEHKRVILMVHRLSPVRKTALYLKEIIKLKEIFHSSILVIVGDGPEKNELVKIVTESELSDSIIFVGSIPNKDIQDYYKVADIFINPSYTEGFPRVIIEAMAFGIPIVATDAGGTSDLFGTLQQRFIVEKTNPARFALKIIELVSTPHIHSMLRDENLSNVQRYTTAEVAKMYEEVIFYENSTYGT